MRKIYTILAISMALVESIASLHAAHAHETWFVKNGQHAGEHFSMDLTYLLVIIGAASVAFSALAIQRTGWFRTLDAFVTKAQRWLPSGIQWRIVAGLTGIMLIANSITGVFLAPDFILPGDGLVILGGMIQLVIGLLLISQISLSLAGALIIMVAIPVAGMYAPGEFLIDYGVEYIALGLAFFFAGLDSEAVRLDYHLGKSAIAPLWRRWGGRICSMGGASEFAHLPLPIIRAGLGLVLIVLSMHHKLTDPNIALTFLDKYQLNFMPQLGLTGFTNLHFVFAAGMAEATLGLLLFAGITTRFVSAGLAIFFLTTLFLLGPIELVGHLPLIGITLMLVCQGSGSRPAAPPDVELALELSTAVST